MIVVWLFLAVPWVCLQFVIVVFPDHTILPFCAWRMTSVRLIIHDTYVTLCNEIFDKFSSGIFVLTTPENIVTTEVTLYDKQRIKLLQ